MSPSSAPRSASERSVSFRWVQLAVPTSSRRTRSRRSSKVVPRNRSALATAAGHSAHGSTRALAHRSTIRRRRASIDPPTAHSWTTVSWPSSSTWLSRECTSMACWPSGPGASTSSRRRRRVAPGGSGAMACQAWGSPPGDARGGAAGPWGVARRPVSLRLAMKPPIERPAGALVAQPGDRGVHHARLRGQGVGVEQGVARISTAPTRSSSKRWKIVLRSRSAGRVLSTTRRKPEPTRAPISGRRSGRSAA